MRPIEWVFVRTSYVSHIPFVRTRHYWCLRWSKEHRRRDARRWQRPEDNADTINNQPSWLLRKALYSTLPLHTIGPENLLLSLTKMSNFKKGKESILELAKLMDATVRVKCLGGRELQGILRGYDELVNLVLDDCDEFLRGELSLECIY